MSPRELFRRDRVLAWTGVLHAALAVVALLLMAVDDRTLLGVSVWSKPLKFMASIAVYLWTLAWLVHHLRDAPRLVRVVSRGVALAMLLETAALWVQAARGTTSHYNVSTPFDAAIFGTMGVLILVNTLLLAVLAAAFFRRRAKLPEAYLWGIRLGLLVIVLGSIEGLAMIANRAHTVGAADGGPGLPLLNWSTEGGDYRVAHALGLHGLQILPFAGWCFSRRNRLLAVQLCCLLVFAAGYFALIAAAFLQARAGVPLIGS